MKQIVQKMPKNWSDDKKVRYVNDYIVRHTAYKLKSKESPYTPYSILFNREGVCEGYALTAYLLLKAADVEIRYISGHADGGLHAWNMVKLKEKWYHLDTRPGMIPSPIVRMKCRRTICLYRMRH